MFLGIVANILVHNPPPIGFFKGFVVEKKRSTQGRTEPEGKRNGIICRHPEVFSLEKGIQETSTVERMEALRSRHGMVEAFGEELKHALILSCPSGSGTSFNRLRRAKGSTTF